MIFKNKENLIVGKIAIKKWKLHVKNLDYYNLAYLFLLGMKKLINMLFNVTIFLFFKIIKDN